MSEQLFDRPEFKLDHQLNPIFAQIKSFKTRKAYESSALYNLYGEEIERVQAGVEWLNSKTDKKPGPFLRVVSWNIERGLRLNGIIHHLKTAPLLSNADIILLTEVDIGMGRSGNENVPARIAEALDMNYCFANSYLVLARGDEGEQIYDLENTLSLHGTAILSRYPMISFHAPEVLQVHDNFYSPEMRLGQRRGLICKIRIGEDYYDFGTVHLDLKASPRQRADQLETVLKAMNHSWSKGKIFGGDLNTHTYDLRSRLRMTTSGLYKLFFAGIQRTILSYMEPHRFYEKVVFDRFDLCGFDYRSFNRFDAGTIYADFEERTVDLKMRRWLPGWAYRWLRKQIAPWGNRFPLRLDWMAGSGIEALQQSEGGYGRPEVVDGLMWEGRRVSDHNAIVADVRLLPQLVAVRQPVDQYVSK